MNSKLGIAILRYAIINLQLKPAMSSSESSYFIGAGVFGGFYSVPPHPLQGRRFVGLEQGNPVGLIYMQLGLEALHQWRTNPLFKPYYHESGVVLDGQPTSGLWACRHREL